MIIVRGELTVPKQNLPKALEISLEHVRLSRGEAGCLSHSVAQDPDMPTRLTFYEEWSDDNALKEHFALTRCQVFFATLKSLAIEEPELKIFTATPVQIR